MGRTVGLIGEVVGKVGNVVFYRRGDKIVSRVYVSNPANPKTSRQGSQRLKMALCGRLSSVVPAAALEGFGGSRTVRRSKFLKNVMTNVVYAGGRASIADNDIVFSEGTLAVVARHTLAAGQSTGNLKRITLTTRLSEGDVMPDGYGERYVVLFLNSGTSQFDYAVTGLVNLEGVESTGGAVTDIQVRVGDDSASYVAIGYIVPFAARFENSYDRFRVSYLGTEEGTVVVDALTGEDVSVPLEFGVSVRRGRVVLDNA